MGAIGYRLRSELRASWRGALGVALLVALLGGVVLASVAGARRTASAYPRLLARTNTAEILVASPDSGSALLYDRVAQLPGVRQVGQVGQIPILPQAGTPTADLVDEGASGEAEDLGVPIASVDGRWGYEFGLTKLASGRMPDPTRADEVLASKILADLAGMEVGDILEVVLVDYDEVSSAFGARPEEGTPMRLTVTGIGVADDEIVAFNDRIHTLSPPSVPWSWVLAATPVALVLANVAAAVPARQAGRVRPANVLRSER